MSFELHHRKHIDDALRKIARRELRHAKDALSSRSGGAFETRVHESRKSVKKVRAVLQIFEQAGAEVPRRDRKRLKEAARALSAVRDSAAIIESFDRLHRRYPKRVPDRTYRILHRALVQASDRQARRARRDGIVTGAARQLAARGEGLAAFDGRCIPAGGVAPRSNTPGILGRRALPTGRLARLGATPDFHHRLLGKTRAAAKQWRLPSLDLPELITVTADSYSRSRKAMRRALETGLSATMHEWRKELKTLWYQLLLIVPLTRGVASLVGDLERLETALGEDHNFVVLGATLRGCTELREAHADVRTVEELATRLRHARRKQIFELGRLLHRRKPKAFARWLRGMSRQARPEAAAA